MISWLDLPWVEIRKKSPNHSSRKGFAIDWITIHYTAGVSTRGAIRWLEMPEAKASAHFVMGSVGGLSQLVDLQRRAWHVGRGGFEIKGKLDRDRPDKAAVGIEIVNAGPVTKKDNGSFVYFVGRHEKVYDVDEFGEPEQARLRITDGPTVEGLWAPYNDNQYVASVLLCAELVRIFDIPLERIVGHQDVAYPPGRKTDPGPLWDWDRFYEGLAEDLGVSVDRDIKRLHRARRG